MNTKKIVDSFMEETMKNNLVDKIVVDEAVVQNEIRFVDKEPPYMKVYLDDISFLGQLSKVENLILHEIFKITQYNTNRVILNKFYRDNIGEKLGIKDQTIRNAISKLKKLNFLIREGVGVYVLNPRYFGSGDWSSLQGLRLIIEYTDQGKSIKLKKMKEKKSS